MALPAYKIHHILDYFSQCMARRILSAETPTDRVIERFPDLTAHRDVIHRISHTIINDIQAETAARDGERNPHPGLVPADIAAAGALSGSPSSEPAASSRAAARHSRRTGTGTAD
ncbi:MAG: hypothetical protein CSB33_01630 [Desulfobacterales bacterium]|nr:MAG: hypothetical protein CSB33_01630 [Desulfobacterales bacterium]